MAGELKLLPFLGEGHICMQTAAAFCLVRAGLLPSCPLGIARRERGKLSHGQPPRSKMICWPMSAGKICCGKGRGSKLWATVLLSARRPHRGNFQTEAAAIRQLAGFFQGLRAANGGIRELSGHWEQLLFEIYGGNITCPQSCPLSCSCLRFFVSVLEPQKQKKSAQLKALRTFVNLGGLWYGGEGGIRTHVPAINR